jgi:chromosomal replication initiation ATPase DnaA
MNYPAPYAVYSGKSARDLIRYAAKVTRCTPDEITGAGRHRPVVHVRWAIIHALRKQGKSLPEIGRAMGGRDHSTICHALEQTAARRKVDDHLDALCNVLAKHAGVAA